MASPYDDEIWRLVPEEPGPPEPHLRDFVLSLPDVERALDLGCGDGRLTDDLRAARTVGADVSEVALQRARKRLPDAELRLVEPDQPLPFEDSSFDLVLCAETVEHVRDAQLLLSEARRVLRPGGELALTTPAHGRRTGLAIIGVGFERVFPPLSPHLRFLSRRSLATLLDDMGFDVGSLERRRGTLLARATR